MDRTLLTVANAQAEATARILAREDTTRERLVILEQQLVAIRKTQEDESHRVKDIQKVVNAYMLDITRYKGFFGGIIFIASCVGIFLKGIPLIKYLLDLKY